MGGARQVGPGQCHTAGRSVDPDLHPHGERNGHAVLTEANVRHIRELRGQMTTREIAKLFKINHGHADNIQDNKDWKHVR